MLTLCFGVRLTSGLFIFLPDTVFTLIFLLLIPAILKFTGGVSICGFSPLEWKCRPSPAFFLLLASPLQVSLRFHPAASLHSPVWGG